MVAFYLYLAEFADIRETNHYIIILLYLVHITKLWANTKVCSNFMKIHYMG